MRKEFLKGVDISFLPQYEDKGCVIKDVDGTRIEPFELLRKYRVNAVRLRIWHTPSNKKESGGYCSLEHTIAMAKRIHEQGMKFMLDFHYSDWWADPAQQNKPAAWENMCFAELEEAVFDYTRDTLLALEEQGVLPEIVQIGNEIRSGLLFPEGQLPDYEGMVRLINAGIRGAREVADKSKMQLMIHLDQGGRFFFLKEWFDKAFEHGLEEFELIGLSFYPFWHGTYQDLKETMERLVSVYKKPIMIVETAHPWRTCENGFVDKKQVEIAGFEADVQGQKRVLDLMMQLVANVPDGMGQGVFYWEPLCPAQHEHGGWDTNMGILDENGRAMESIQSFLFEREHCSSEVLAKLLSMRQVKDNQDAIHLLSGKANLLRNADWEDGLLHWNMTENTENVMAQIYPEFVDPFPAPPVNAIRVEANKQFVYRLEQEVEIPPGNYRLQAQIKGVDTTNVNVRLFALDGDKEYFEVIHPTEHMWEPYTMENVKCNTGRLKVGICIDAPPMYLLVKKFALVNEGE